jgi:hypothetical protein
MADDPSFASAMKSRLAPCAPRLLATSISYYEKAKAIADFIGASALALVLLCAAMFGTSGCGGGVSSGGSPGPGTLSSLTITAANSTIQVGQTEQFTAQGNFSGGSKQDMTNTVTWASSNTGIATISASGKVTAVAQGSTTISASSGAVTNSIGLTVIPPTLASISLVPANAMVNIGAPVQLTATGTFADGSTQIITNKATWSSSNTNVATVNGSGLVTGVADGMLTISASLDSTTGTDAVTVATSTGLPTGIGWHALASNTMLQASGACPLDNFGGDPFLFSEGCSNVIRSWSGAIEDTTANRLILWGGGHTNYYGNEIYSLNLGVNPVTLTRLKDPTVPTNFANSGNCVESISSSSTGVAPNSRSTYGGMAFLPNEDAMYVLNGSLACQQSGGSTATWSISLNNLSNSSSWIYENPTMTGPQPGIFNGLGGSSYGNIAAYDTNTGLVFVSDSSAIFTYNHQANTYSRISTANGFPTSIYLSGAIDPVRKLFLALGGCNGGTCGPGDGVFVADISNPTTTSVQDWTAATMADPNCKEFLGGGANPIGAANPGIAYDSVANDFVGWPNQGDSVYIMTPDAVNQRLTCQKLTFPNGPPNSAHAHNTSNTSNGTFGRFQYFPGSDLFVLANDWNIPAYVLRLR